jgi:DNA-binding transcriptional LysR family regulator
MAVNNVYTAMSLARAGIGIALANPLLLLGSDGPGLIARPFHPAVPLMLGVLRALPHADTPEIEALVRHAKGVASSSVGPLRALGIDVSVPVLQGHG